MSAALSILIVNYNAGEWLRVCVDSLLSYPAEIEIIVVDNASTDNSLDALHGFPYVKIIRNETNLGFAAACNIGYRQASSNHVLFLNPDCTVDASSIHELLSVMDSDEHIGMVGGFLSNLDGTEQAGGRRAIPTPWRSFVRAFGLSRFARRWPKLFFDFHLHKQALPTQPIDVEAISGACMLVKREAVEDVGLWDEGYFLHCEDLDWCMRFRQKGWRILFVPDAKIIHEQGACSRSKPIFVEWHKHKGMMRFYMKFFRHQYPGMLMAFVAFGVWLRFAAVASYYFMRRLRDSLHA